MGVTLLAFFDKLFHRMTFISVRQEISKKRGFKAGLVLCLTALAVIVSHSVCSGIALGKHGDEFDNTAGSTKGYVKTIERAHAHPIPWTRENIGHHIVRNNTISHCEQTGIVGSMGCAFSIVTGNVIHDIHVRRLFSGAEMAGIKFHGPIDTVIRGNHIHHAFIRLWLDWRAQGARVSHNLFHDNSHADLLLEVNHGPCVVDNNLFLSNVSLLDRSQGGAFAYNLFAGRIISIPELKRETPYHPAHSTTIAGLTNTPGGDNRFFNNILLGNGNPVAATDPGWDGSFGLWVYHFRALPMLTGGNVYYHGAKPYGQETDAIVLANDPKPILVQQGERFVLQFTPGGELNQAATAHVTSRRLGLAKIPGLPYENADGSPVRIDTDYFGTKRSRSKPTAGPFEKPGDAPLALTVWPQK